MTGRVVAVFPTIFIEIDKFITVITPCLIIWSITMCRRNIFQKDNLFFLCPWKYMYVRVGDSNFMLRITSSTWKLCLCKLPPPSFPASSDHLCNIEVIYFPFFYQICCYGKNILHRLSFLFSFSIFHFKRRNHLSGRPPLSCQWSWSCHPTRVANGYVIHERFLFKFKSCVILDLNPTWIDSIGICLLVCQMFVYYIGVITIYELGHNSWSNN